MVAQFVKLLAGGVARGGGFRHLQRGEYDHAQPRRFGFHRDFDRAGVATRVGDDEYGVAWLNIVLEGVTLKQTRAVAWDLLRPTVGGVVDAADGDQPAGAALNLGGEDLRVSTAEGVQDAVGCDRCGDLLAGGAQGVGVGAAHLGLECSAGFEESIG